MVEHSRDPRLDLFCPDTPLRVMCTSAAALTPRLITNHICGSATNQSVYTCQCHLR